MTRVRAARAPKSPRLRGSPSPLRTGATYFIRVSGYFGESGVGRLNVRASSLAPATGTEAGRSTRRTSSTSFRVSSWAGPTSTSLARRTPRTSLTSLGASSPVAECSKPTAAPSRTAPDSPERPHVRVQRARPEPLIQRYTAGMEPDADVTRILNGPSAAVGEPAGRLLELVYAQLRKIAQQRMYEERPDHTLTATAWCTRRISGSWGTNLSPGRAGRTSMRRAPRRCGRILIEHARARGEFEARRRRGGTPRQAAPDRAPGPGGARRTLKRL